MEKYILLSKVLNFGNRKICIGQNLVSTRHVKGLAVVFSATDRQSKTAQFWHKSQLQLQNYGLFF
jgi:hypothetical protein